MEPNVGSVEAAWAGGAWADEGGKRIEEPEPPFETDGLTGLPGGGAGKWLGGFDRHAYHEWRKALVRRTAAHARPWERVAVRHRGSGRKIIGVSTWAGWLTAGGSEHAADILFPMEGAFRTVERGYTGARGPVRSPSGSALGGPGCTNRTARFER
jgi:hypothetical protein